jgi:hypothetical protein
MLASNHRSSRISWISSASARSRLWREPPAFSPAGDRIALTGYFLEELCSDTYTMSLTGSNPHAVTHNCEDFNNGGPGGFAAQPSWQPVPQP